MMDLSYDKHTCISIYIQYVLSIIHTQNIFFPLYVIHDGR